MKLDFTGKNVLVTGGNSDVGLSLAKLVMDAGLFPVLVARNEKKRQRIADSLHGHSGKYDTTVMDFSKISSVNAFTAAMETCPDYLVDLYQSDYESMVAASDTSRVSEYMACNLTARAALIRFLSRRMLKQKFGRMIFISSVAADYPAQGQGFYAASKLAGEALYKNIGIELGRRGVTTFAIRPGYIDSGRGARFLEKRQVPWVIEKKALCETILFFLSKSAHRFNAGHVVMDGGLSSGKPE